MFYKGEQREVSDKKLNFLEQLGKNSSSQFSEEIQSDKKEKKSAGSYLE